MPSEGPEVDRWWAADGTTVGFLREAISLGRREGMAGQHLSAMCSARDDLLELRTAVLGLLATRQGQAALAELERGVGLHTPDGKAWIAAQQAVFSEVDLENLTDAPEDVQASLPRPPAPSLLAGAPAPDVEAVDETEDRMQDALHRILGWAEAYPVQAFPKPDLTAIRAQIGDGPYSALHASWARHLLDGIARYARAGLGQGPAPASTPKLSDRDQVRRLEGDLAVAAALVGELMAVPPAGGLRPEIASMADWLAKRTG